MGLRKSIFMRAAIITGALLTSVSLINTSVQAKSSGSLTVSTFGLSTKQMQSDVLTPFSKKTNVKINTQFGDSATRLTQIEKNKNSNVDVVELSQNNALTANNEKVFQKLDFSKLKNFKYLSKSEQKLAKETNSIPYTINSVGIVYNAKKVGKITSWNQLWSSKLKNKISIPDVTTTFGPAMLYIAADHSGKSITSKSGASAFSALKSLKPNLVKTYTQSSDLANMFNSGEIQAAVVGDYAVGMLETSNSSLRYVVPNSGTYANYDTVSIVKGTKNLKAAYKYLDYRISKSVQKKVAKTSSLNNAPVNTKVKLSAANAKNKTYGKIADRAKTIDFKYVNAHLKNWITRWNSLINN
ncbi:spermidine/putrescine ABC transporter substrate-binding protein [Oenococcus oeni]|uniref:ABC transporter substrate-binding protein n=1 Tax=Oenococcus oeni TaxID=1247 RepID=UPI0008F82254|nr:ABC transporter substrate-binding protein [Oenococcus oeni]OIL37601.1 spermidine/putrescine ABC transporter substrate-binding protein [Oenococcus oeni]OIM25420.1 spermidine/putrescine ABC transporter substrate-binding protein [Oenococcus oeni]